MSRSRVFILFGRGLFARGVQSLLSREHQVEVVGVERVQRQALATIRRLHPDVILLDSGAGQEDTSLTLPEIFREIPEARVISLDLNGNGIDIYDKQRIIASGPEDLVRAIRQGTMGHESIVECPESRSA